MNNKKAKILLAKNISEMTTDELYNQVKEEAAIKVTKRLSQGSNLRLSQGKFKVKKKHSLMAVFFD